MAKYICTFKNKYSEADDDKTKFYDDGTEVSAESFGMAKAKYTVRMLGRPDPLSKETSDLNTTGKFTMPAKPVVVSVRPVTEETFTLTVYLQKYKTDEEGKSVPDGDPVKYKEFPNLFGNTSYPLEALDETLVPASYTILKGSLDTHAEYKMSEQDVNGKKVKVKVPVAYHIHMPCRDATVTVRQSK